jgi:hypothetical protein
MTEEQMTTEQAEVLNAARALELAWAVETLRCMEEPREATLVLRAIERKIERVCNAIRAIDASRSSSPANEPAEQHQEQRPHQGAQ